MNPYLMIDRATYGDELISTASQMGALAIAGYVFDHFLSDINGYCGGWTPQAIQRIYAAGLDFHPIFVFRDGETPPTPERCVEILKALGVHEGAWCHGDYEGDAISTPAQAAALTAALHAGGYRSAPYGTAGTLNQGYLAGADAPWVAYYLGQPWDNLAGVDLTNMPNVGIWQYAAWQYANSNSVNGVVVDVSISNLPIGGVLAATSTAGGDDLTSDQDAILRNAYNDIEHIKQLLLAGIDSDGNKTWLKDTDAVVRDTYNNTVHTQQAVAAVQAEIDTLKASTDPTVAAAVARIEAALKQA